MPRPTSSDFSRRTVLGGAGAVSLAGLLAACGAGGTGASGPSGPGVTTPRATVDGDPNATLRVAVSRNLALGVKDPYFTHTSLMVHEPLVVLDKGLQPSPGLAERWEQSADGLTWTFHLRRNVTFHDGQPFNADAVIANIRRYHQISPRPSSFTTMNAKVAYGPVADLAAVDPHTVRIAHHTPYPLLPATMSNFFSAMFSPASFTTSGDFAGLPMATGPFKLVDWGLDRFARLERNDAYRGPKAKVQRIEVRVLPDANSRVAAVSAGEVDAVVELGGLLFSQARDLARNPQVSVGADPISITQYLYFNCSQPPFNDVRLRRAVAGSLDLRSITEDLVYGYGKPGQSLVSPISTRWFSAKGTPRFDPKWAAEQAAHALGGRRLEAVLPFNVSPGQARPYKETGAYMAAVLAPLGIDVKLQQMESAALTDRVNRGDWNLRFSQLGWANGDADFIMSYIVSSTGTSNVAQKGGYRNEEADRLCEQGVPERDLEKRFTIYERLQEIAADEVPAMALYHEDCPYAFRKNVAGLHQRSNFQPTFDTVQKARS